MIVLAAFKKISSFHTILLQIHVQIKPLDMGIGTGDFNLAPTSCRWQQLLAQNKVSIKYNLWSMLD